MDLILPERATPLHAELETQESAVIDQPRQLQSISFILSGASEGAGRL